MLHIFTITKFNLFAITKITDTIKLWLGYLLQQKIITSSGKMPTFLQLILRNVISFVWFVEAFIIFVLKKPRFGDAIAGTIVVSESKGNDH